MGDQTFMKSLAFGLMLSQSQGISNPSIMGFQILPIPQTKHGIGMDLKSKSFQIHSFLANQMGL